MEVVSNVSPREHIEFVREGDVVWTGFDPNGAPSGRQVKHLTRGTDSAAFSGLVRYPAGFEAPFGAHTRQIELFVLDGALGVGDVECGPNTYLFVPAGVGYGPVVAHEEATILAHYEGSADLVEPWSDAESTVIDTDTWEWTWGTGAGLPKGLCHKTVRYDEATGERTFLLGVVPWWDSPLLEFHPCVEECYVIQGDMFMDNVAELGAMGPGDYFWRDPWVTHGPMRTKGGFIALLRHDRHHVNYFIDQSGTTPEENRALVESGHFDE